LFVCTANLQRSPTAQHLFQGWKGIWEAKSAGISPDPGKIPLTQALVDWADLILAMESIHSQFLRSHFKCDPGKIRILGIADVYFRDDPELISILQKKVPPILAE
jgi:predicted protein tyrosine phosphatase